MKISSEHQRKSNSNSRNIILTIPSSQKEHLPCHVPSNLIYLEKKINKKVWSVEVFDMRGIQKQSM